MYIKTASQYCGRIVSGIDDCYESLAANMAAHYATEKLMAVEVLEGGLYCVQEKETYHRLVHHTASLSQVSTPHSQPITG